MITLPRHLLNNWLTAFECSRVENHTLVTQFVEKLETQMASASLNPSFKKASNYQMGKGWRSSPDSKVSLWKTIRLAWQERTYLQTVFRRTRKGNVWVLADERRSGSLRSWDDLEKQVRMFNGMGTPKAFQRQPQDTENLVFFSPNLFANQETSNHAVDTQLSYLSLFAVPLAFPVLFVCSLIQIITNNQVRSLVQRKTWITTLLAASIWVLLKHQQPDRLLMLTSNSFVIELIRYLYAASNIGNGITEVLHGIPSCEIVTYHNTLFKVAPSQLHHRICFIPPVPEFCITNWANGIQVEPCAVNLKINSIVRNRDLDSMSDLFRQRTLSRNHAWVIALNGAGTVENKQFLDTGCFAFEKKILAHLLESASQLELKIHLQYSIHPAHIKSGDSLKITQTLAAMPVEVLEDSFQTWLESDLCISIFSSASWDAQALGCRVAISVCPEDELYNPELLKSFAHPSTKKSLLDILTEELQSMPTWKRVTFHERLHRIGLRFEQ